MSTSLAWYLNPRDSFNVPLVELPESLNPFIANKVRIFASLMALSPLGVSKWFSAYSMLLDAQINLELADKHTIVAATSGNMGECLGKLAPLFGIQKVLLVVPWDIAPLREQLLKVAGMQVIPRKDSAMDFAKELARQPGWINFDQYENPANPLGFENWYGPNLRKKTGGKITVFGAGMGSMGTILGTGRYLKSWNSKIITVGVYPDQNAIPGVRTKKRLEEVKLYCQHHQEVDYEIEIKVPVAYKASRRLFANGFPAGPSSGMALEGVCEFFRMAILRDSLDAMRNEDGEVVAVFACPDSPHAYVEKYSTWLDASDFS